MVTCEVAADFRDPLADATPIFRPQKQLPIYWLFIRFVRYSDSYLLLFRHILMLLIGRYASTDHFIADIRLVLGCFWAEWGRYETGKMKSKWESILTMDIVFIVPYGKSITFLDDPQITKFISAYIFEVLFWWSSGGNLELVCQYRWVIFWSLLKLFFVFGLGAFPKCLFMSCECQEDLWGRIRFGCVYKNISLNFLPGKIKLFIDIDKDSGFGFWVSH